MDDLQPNPCRLCGSPAMVMQIGATGRFVVECNNDGTLGRDVTPCGEVGPECASADEAVTAWNTQARDIARAAMTIRYL